MPRRRKVESPTKTSHTPHDFEAGAKGAEDVVVHVAKRHMQSHDIVKAKVGNTRGDRADTRRGVQSEASIKRASTRRALGIFRSFPMEVHLGIFSHSDAYDLLRLSRSSKLLRSLLMKRSERPLWQAAIERSGLPPCPDDMCEPAYISLAFDRWCTECDNSRSQTTFWQLRMRLCRGCFGGGTGVVLFLTLHKSLQRGVTWPFGVSQAGILPYVGDLQTSKYSKAMRDALVRQLVKFETSEELSRFLTDRLKYVENMMAHARKCREWADETTRRIAENITRKRVQDIRAKLEELGYANELGAEPWFHTLHMLQPKPLTVRGWEKIKPELVARLEEIRRGSTHPVALAQEQPRSVQ